MKWRKIEDGAPKDGTKVDLWANGRRWPNSYYHPRGWVGEFPAWVVSDERATCLPINAQCHDAPTHWMHLPEPPAEE